MRLDMQRVPENCGQELQMIEIKLSLTDETADIIGIKECISYCCENLGNIKLISVEEIKQPDGQLSLWGEQKWTTKNVDSRGDKI